MFKIWAYVSLYLSFCIVLGILLAGCSTSNDQWATYSSVTKAVITRQED